MRCVDDLRTGVQLPSPPPFLALKIESDQNPISVCASGPWIFHSATLTLRSDLQTNLSVRCFFSLSRITCLYLYSICQDDLEPRCDLVLKETRKLCVLIQCWWFSS